MLAWLSVWSEVQTCIWPSWCHCHSLSLASVKSRLVLPFWYQLTWVVPDKGPLTGVCVVLVPIDRTYNFLLVFPDNYISIFYHLSDITTSFPQNFKRSYMTINTTPCNGILTCIRLYSLWSICATKLTCLASTTKKIWLGPENLEIGHVTLTTPTWETVGHHKPNTQHGQLVYKNLKPLTLAIPGIFQGVKIYNESHNPNHAPFRNEFPTINTILQLCYNQHKHQIWRPVSTTAKTAAADKTVSGITFEFGSRWLVLRDLTSQCLPALHLKHSVICTNQQRGIRNVEAVKR